MIILGLNAFHADSAAAIIRDGELIDIRGRGVYAGTLFQVTNSTKGWWGEGDEKIWVDSENFPSHFGTGTEGAGVQPG